MPGFRRRTLNHAISDRNRRGWFSHIPFRTWGCSGSAGRVVDGCFRLLLLDVGVDRGMALPTERTLRWQQQERCECCSRSATTGGERSPRTQGHGWGRPNKQAKPSLVSNIGRRKGEQSQKRSQARDQQQPLKRAHSSGPLQRFNGARSSSSPSNRRTTRKSTISFNDSGRVYQAGMGAAMVAPASARPVRLRR